MAGSPTAAAWLLKAEDARQLADTMNDAGARQTMLIIAAGYEKMAQHAALTAGLQSTSHQGSDRPIPRGLYREPDGWVVVDYGNHGRKRTLMSIPHPRYEVSGYEPPYDLLPSRDVYVALQEQLPPA